MSTPMPLSATTLHALERHFLGTLSLPPRQWLTPTAGPVLLFSGAAMGRLPLRPALQASGVDLGAVASPGTERRDIAVASLAAEPVTLSIAGAPPWLAARWRQNGPRVHLRYGGPAATLELVAAHDVVEAATFEGAVRLATTTLSGAAGGAEIHVRMAVPLSQPWGEYDFQGSATPRAHDFGIVSALSKDAAEGDGAAAPTYAMSFGNLTSAPLKVAFADLPAWLTFEVDGHLRQGPAAGRFFEREAPFSARIRPCRGASAAAIRQGCLRLVTNDVREPYRAAELDFSATFPSPANGAPRIAAGADAVAPASGSWMPLLWIAALLVVLLLGLVALALHRVS